MDSRRGTRFALAISASVGVSNVAFAADFSWINPAGGSYHDASNWSPAGGPPDGSSKVILDLPGSYTINFATDVASLSLEVQRGDPTLTLPSEFSPTYSPGPIRVGTIAHQPAMLTIENAGTFIYSGAGGVSMAEPYYSNATLTLSASHIRMASVSAIGVHGNATLLLSNAARFTSMTRLDFIIAEFQSANAIIRLADQSGLSIGGTAIIGAAGNGSMEVTGGSVFGTQGTTLGQFSSGFGSIHVDGPGSDWYVHSTLKVGDQGDGEIRVSDGARLMWSSAWYLGMSSTGSGTATISGATTYAEPALYAFVGYNGRGNLNLVDGARFDTSVMLGLLPGSSGSLFVSGAETNLRGHISIGRGNIHDDTFAGGVGTITLNGGTIDASSLLVKRDCFVHYNEGMLRAGTLDVRDGNVLLARDADVLLQANRVTVVSNDGVGIIDLNNNDLKASDTTYSDMVAMLRSPRWYPSPGFFRGGIGSSAAKENPLHNTTLGVVTGDQYLFANGPDATFHDAPVAVTDVLVKYTYFGDTNLDGVVGFDDYARTDFGSNNHIGQWFYGDFDLNGIVDFEDYALLDLGFNTQNGTLIDALNWLEGENRSGSAGPGVDMVARHFEMFGVDYANAFYASVPEPSLMVLPSAMALLYTRDGCRRLRKSSNLIIPRRADDI